MNPDLEKWIDEASKGLEPLAREKITEQITEHYEDSVSSYRSSGSSEIEACSRAVINLGDSKKTRQEFGRIYLSESEFAWLEYDGDAWFGFRTLIMSFWIYLASIFYICIPITLVQVLGLLLASFWTTLLFSSQFIMRLIDSNPMTTYGMAGKMAQNLINASFILIMLILYYSFMAYVVSSVPRLSTLMDYLKTLYFLFIFYNAFKTIFKEITLFLRLFRRARALSK